MDFDAGFAANFAVFVPADGLVVSSVVGVERGDLVLRTFVTFAGFDATERFPLSERVASEGAGPDWPAVAVDWAETAEESGEVDVCSAD